MKLNQTAVSLKECVCCNIYCDYSVGKAEINKVKHVYEGNSLFTKVKYHNDVVFDQS